MYRGAGTHDLLKVNVPPLPTPEGEEAIYLDLIQNYKVILTSGASCLAEEPGWFRICFAYPYVGQRDDVTEAMGELKKRLI